MVCVFAYTASVKSEAATARRAALDHYGGEQAAVMVARTDIPVGTRLESSNVQEATWVVDLLPAGKIATKPAEVEGQVAQIDIKANEPIMLERIGDGSSRIAVPTGLSAVSVSSDDVLAVGGAITAGSFVDVYVESGGKVVLLGEDILVLETSTKEQAQDAKITWVTLAVTPQSVSDLLSAAAKGAIHLVLPGKDEAPQTNEGANNG